MKGYGSAAKHHSDGEGKHSIKLVNFTYKYISYPISIKYYRSWEHLNIGHYYVLHLHFFYMNMNLVSWTYRFIMLWYLGDNKSTITLIPMSIIV
jgi:hypothetical protein